MDPASVLVLVAKVARTTLRVPLLGHEGVLDRILDHERRVTPAVPAGGEP
jgi:hypothetical protein